MAKLPLVHANIIRLLGVEDLPVEERIAIVESAIELVETRTLSRVLEKLDDGENQSSNKRLRRRIAMPCRKF